MLDNQTVGIILPTYNEEAGLSKILPQLSSLSILDVVMVVDNNSTDRSNEVGRDFGALLITATNQGYGSAIKAGLMSLQTDWIIVMEPDGTFAVNDLQKLFVYRNDADAILGTRTSKSLIWESSYMPHWVKWGNWCVAKMIEVLFNGPSLTDAGCTLKLIKRDLLKDIPLTSFTDKSHFNAELLIGLCMSNRKIIEIPINYLPRIGESKITGDNTVRTIKVGIRMIMSIFKFRFLVFERRKG